MTDLEKRYRKFRRSITIKTRDDLLSSSMFNRFEDEPEPGMKLKPVKREGQHHAKSKLRDGNHKPAGKSARPKRVYQPVVHLPEPGEVPIKVWAQEIVEREGIVLSTVWTRIKRGKYPNVSFRRVNARVVFIRENKI